MCIYIYTHMYICIQSIQIRTCVPNDFCNFCMLCTRHQQACRTHSKKVGASSRCVSCPGRSLGSAALSGHPWLGIVTIPPTKKRWWLGGGANDIALQFYPNYIILYPHGCYHCYHALSNPLVHPQYPHIFWPFYWNTPFSVTSGCILVLIPMPPNISTP